jgi:hypothetical protein
MELIIPMTAGLLLDICGTLLILKPFMFISKNMRLRDYPSITSVAEEVGEDWFYYIEELDKKISEKNRDDRKKNQKYADDVKWGFVFLAFGFFLILIASWINYIETW